MNAPKFKLGDAVLVIQPQPKYEPPVPPVPAFITRIEPYPIADTMGYYVSYPGATEMWHCHGGWVMESILVPAEAR